MNATSCEAGVSADDRWFSGLYYSTVGTGPPIVALHGFCETHETWRELVERQKGDFTFYLFDLKGHGKSNKPRDGRYSLDDHAASICDFIRHLDLRDVTLLGHSMGGGIALLIALRFIAESDQRINSLILIDSIGAPQRVPLFIKMLKYQSLVRFALSFVSAKFFVRHILQGAYIDKSKLSNASIIAYAENLESSEGVYALSTTARQLLSANADYLDYEFHSIIVPALLLWGIEDHIVSPHVGIFLNTQLENSELEFLCSGHMPQEEIPDIVSEKISIFLNKIRATVAI